jgi:hypothetical protein
MSDSGLPTPRRFAGVPVYVGLAVVAYLIAAIPLALPTPPAEVVVIGLPSLYGLTYWLAGGSPFLPAVAWTGLLATWMAINFLVVPHPIGLIGLLVGVAVVLAMTTSLRAMTWWLQRFERGH